MAPSKWTQPPAPPRMSYWLTFPQEEDESVFRGRQTPAWTLWDRSLFFTALFYGPAKVASFTSPIVFHTIVHHVWFIFTTVCCPLTFLAMIMSNGYHAKRHRMISIFRMFVLMGGGLSFFVHDPVELWVPTPTVLLARMITQAPICGLFITTLHRLPFRRHFWVHLCSALFSCLWVRNLCDGCSANPEVDHAVNRIGWQTEGVIVRMAVLGLPVNRHPLEEGQYSCWLVGLFYHFWLGFFVPSVGVYVSELLSRITFLRDLMGPGTDKELKLFKVGRLILTGVVLVIGTQVIWIFLKGVLTREVVCAK